MAFELENRTLIFGKKVVKLCSVLPKNQINFRLCDQLVRSGTSVGANYREANETDTGKDFKNRIRIAKKEAKETVYWLDLILDSNPEFSKEIEELLDEAGQLVKILASIYLK